MDQVYLKKKIYKKICLEFVSLDLLQRIDYFLLLKLTHTKILVFDLTVLVSQVYVYMVFILIE